MCRGRLIWPKKRFRNSDLSQFPFLLGREVGRCASLIFFRTQCSSPAIAWRADTDPCRTCSRKHVCGDLGDGHDDEGDHEWGDDGHLKDQQAPDKGTHEHGRHCNQASACSRSASAHQTTVCREADDGLGEDGGRQIWHSEFVSDGALDPHRYAQHDDETRAGAC